MLHKESMILTLFLLSLPGISSAEIHNPEQAEVFSRGLQQAKRMASLESQQEIPSRGYWLSQHLAKKNKNLSHQKTKKAPASSIN